MNYATGRFPRDSVVISVRNNEGGLGQDCFRGAEAYRTTTRRPAADSAAGQDRRGLRLSLASGGELKDDYDQAENYRQLHGNRIYALEQEPAPTLLPDCA
jgi:hypothetical protein